MLNCGSTIVIFLIISYVVAESRFRNANICGKPTCKASTKFRYKEKVNYIYQYSATSSTKFDGAGTNSSDMTITFTVNLYFRSKCDGIMKLSNAEIFHGTDGNFNGSSSEEFNRALTSNHLRFYFDDGTISQLCPSKDELVWVLNLKRGVLSTIQNTMDRFDIDQHLWERDINGDCMHGYYFKEVNGTTLKIDKKLDVSSCFKRHQVYSIIPMTPYVFQKRHHKWTPLNSSVACTQYIDRKILTNVACREEHNYQPFYNQSNGAKTMTKNKLTLLHEESSSSFEIQEMKQMSPVEIRQDLLFDHRRPIKPTHDNLNECNHLMTLLCEMNLVEFQPKYTDVFNKFIHVARDLSIPALTQLYQESKSICDSGRKHMLDALPYIRSRASNKIMTEIILNSEVSKSTMNEWLLIMTFSPRPDAETIDAVVRLLLDEEFNIQTALTVTTMVHNFCDNFRDCHLKKSVSDLVTKLESMTKYACLSRNESQAYGVLKALGNAGVLTTTLPTTLKNCFENENLPTDIRTLAVESHRRLPCDTNRETLLTMFKNQSVVGEIRIAAYLQLMRCPTYSILRAIKTSLDEEEYNQVGSLVWSHLKTQMKSALPTRVEIQAMLQDETLNDKFEKDGRKFSKTYEHSFFLNQFGVGGFLETTVIFSSKSYIPRTAVFNVTINVFGETLNLFEVTLGLEGLEPYAETLFLNAGIFSKEFLSKTFRAIRVMRSEPDPLNVLLNELPFKKVLDDIKITASIKMFGNEVKYFSIIGPMEFLDEIQKLNPMTIINDFFSGREINFSGSSMLIDTSYVTPLMIGLPLKLDVVGTAAMNLDAKGFVNASTFSTDRNLELNGKLLPSIGFTLECSMNVDAFITKSGVKFKSTIYTSTALEGSFTMNEYKFIRFSFNLPLQKSNIVHAETHLLLTLHENERELKGITAGRTENHICTWSIIEEAIGLKLCANTLLPDKEHLLKSPLFLFSGPLTLGVSLEKSDPSAKQYTIEYRLDTLNNKTVMVFKFETPGSNIKRGIEAVVDLDTQSQNLTLNYQSRLSTVKAQGYYRNTPNEKFIHFGLDINGKKHIDIQIGIDITVGKYGNTYAPKLIFAINNKRIVALTGSLKWVDKKGISQCDIELDFQTNRFATIIGGYARLSDASFATNIKMNYKFGTGDPQSVRVEFKIGNKSSKFLTYYKGQLQLESSAYPEIDSIVSFKFQKAQSHIDCHLKMLTNPNIEDNNQKLMVLWNLQQYQAFALTKLNTSLEIVKPNSDIDIKLGFIKHNRGSNSTSMVIVRYAKGKEIVFTFDMNMPHGTFFFFESRLRIILIYSAVEQMSLYGKIFEKSDRDYDLEFLGSWFSGHNLTVRGMYQDHSDLIVSSHNFKLLARSQLFNDILITARFIYRDIEFKSDLQAEHNDKKYGMSFRHTSQSAGNYETFCEVTFNMTAYSITNMIDLIHRRTKFELHLDQYRDIHIDMHGISNKTVFDCGVDVKWDANRDPSQKLMVAALSNAYGNFNYDGKFIVEYPGRTVTSLFFIQHKFVDYHFYGKLEWNPKSAVIAIFNGIYDLNENQFARIEGKVDTPFKKWEYTSLSAQLKLQPQALKLNGSLNWQSDQKVDVEMSYSYNFSSDGSYMSIIGLMNSSIPDVNSVKATLKYKQLPHLFASGIFLQSSPTNVFAVDCSGEIKDEDLYTRYNLVFSLLTPFETIRYTDTAVSLMIHPIKKFKLNLHLAGNGKKYVTTVDGSFQFLNESKLDFHIATPFERYKVISGTYSFSASRKVFIAEIQSPTKTGAQLTYIYNNVSNFDLKLNLYTSVNFASNLLVVGKRDVDTIDLRFGWNKLMVGFIGRSHYISWNDVDYSLQLFTPIEGYHSGSAFAKLIYKNTTEIDIETSINLGTKKVGLKIQAKKKPERYFAQPYIPPPQEVNATKSLIEPFNYDEIDYGNTFWRGVFQFNSPMYPTVHGFLQINGYDTTTYHYNTLSYISFPFGQLRLEDDLRFTDFLNAKNDLRIITSCSCLKKTDANFVVEEALDGRLMTSKLELTVHAHNETYEGALGGHYEYKPDSEENDAEGLHNVSVKVKTPFQRLSHGYINLLVDTVSPVYVGNLSAGINNSSFRFDGSLENDGSFFLTDVGLEVTSPIFNLPMCRLLLNKDFADLDRELKVGLSFPNQRGDSLVYYGVSLTWRYDGPQFIKYDLEVTTPYPNLGNVKHTLTYTSTSSLEEYFLELYFKFSKFNEIASWSSVQKDIFNFHVVSSYEGIRNISISGTLKNKGGGKSLDAVMSSDKEYRMLGWASNKPNRPFMVEVKLLKTTTNEEEFGISLSVLKKNNRYKVNALVQRHNRRINLLCDYILLEEMGNIVNLMLSSNYPGYEEISLDGVFLNQEYRAAVAKLAINVTSKWITTNVNLNINVSVQEDIGVLNVQLFNPNVTADGQISWVNQALEHTAFDLLGKGSYRGIKKELLAHFHVWNIQNEFQQFSVATDINYNLQEWWLSTNFTFLWPLWNDLQFVSYAILPYNIDERHVTLAKLFYEEDFSYNALIFKYFSNPKSFKFQTLTEVKINSGNTRGAVLLQTEQYQIYNHFRALSKKDAYNIHNILQSTNLKEDLVVDIAYKKPSLKQHNVKLLVFYPEPNSIVEIHSDFSALNNLTAVINCTTPFKAFPTIRIFLKLITTRPFYQRLCQLLWANQSAMFNYTHASIWAGDAQITDGNILMDFPLTSRHIGLLNYKYESKERVALGHSSLAYNGEVITSGNYSRFSQFTEKSTNEIININVNNSYVPTGIIYIKNYSQISASQIYPKSDFRRIELYKLYDKDGFNIVGELEIDKTETKANTTLRVMHFTRKFVFTTTTEGQKKYTSNANFTFKPNKWIAAGLLVNDKDYITGKYLELMVAYPRRHFSITGDYDWTDNVINCEVDLQPNKYQKAKSVTGAFHWATEPKLSNHTVRTILAHPSFIKNVTLFGHYTRNELHPMTINLELEYSTDINKKVSFNSFIKNNSEAKKSFYECTAYGSHPASRLKLTGFGFLEIFEKTVSLSQNITYKRSYLPLQYWFNSAKLDALKNFMEIERNSLRESSYVNARFGRNSSTYIANATFINGDDIKVTGEFFFNTDLYLTKLLVNMTPDTSEKLCMEGSHKDNRHTVLNVWRMYDDISISDVSFSTRLNHSRLFTSSLIWRPEIRSDLTDVLQVSSNSILNYVGDTVNFWAQYFKNEITDSVMDIWFDAKPILQDFLDDVRDVRYFEEDIEIFKREFKESYDENEFYMQDIYEMYLTLAEEISFKEKMAHVPKIVNELWEVMGETGETIRQSILWLVESVKKVYTKVFEFIRGLLTGETIDKISEYVQNIAGKYDKIIRDMHISFLQYVENLWAEVVERIVQYWSKTLKSIEPTFIQFAHHIESVFYESSKKVLEFLYTQQSELFKSSVFQKNKNLTKNLDSFYEDITKNDFITNVKKYANLLIELIRDQYFTVLPFGNELNQIGSEIVEEIKELYKLPLVNLTIEMSKEVYSKVSWLYNYFQVKERFQKLVPIIYNAIIDYTHTALDNELINHGARTRFIFEPGFGQIVLEQKLPMPWHSFNESPNYEEIAEYKALLTVQHFFAPSNKSFWAYYYYYVPLIDPALWFPPFSSQALIVGNQHFVTFDGNHLETTDDCLYLLANDFIGNTFSLFSKNSKDDSNVLILLCKNKKITIDFNKKVISLQDVKNLHLPLQVDSTYIYSQEGVVFIIDKHGFELQCNFKYGVCKFILSGWHFGKTAGLLGTMDNEPNTDFFSSKGVLLKNKREFANSWALGVCNRNLIPYKRGDNHTNSDICDSLFNTKNSAFSSCYSIVESRPYFELCHRQHFDIYGEEFCTSAFAYVEACKNELIPLRLPTSCVICLLPNGKLLEEGDFDTLDEFSRIPQSTDVVFIVEAKECNQYMRDRRMVHTFATILAKELNNAGISKSRYAVVTFGGEGVFDEPHSVVVNNQVFTNENELPNHFENIISGNGNTDIFAALKYATQLKYRAGVSKTFVLIPCSDCDLANMTVEYNVLNQVFLEQNITLHVLMNADFDFEKLRVSKMFYGLDSERAFTKSDFKALKGDMDLRRQIKLTKSMMGYCTTLALETNGTIFTGKKMGSENLALVKKFSSVFARRIAATAHPDSCQNCECVANEHGIDYVECMPCSIPIPAYTDFDFQENGTLSFLQAFDQFGDADKKMGGAPFLRGGRAYRTYECGYRIDNLKAYFNIF